MTGKTVAADVLIIGAGASGGIAAKFLAMAGLDVVVLEQGHWPDPGRFPGARPEYEFEHFGHYNPEPNSRNWPEDYPLNLENSDLPVFMYPGVGGSMTHFAAVWSRSLPEDFRVRSLDGVADDWPLTYEDLLPHYEANDIDIGAAGLGGNPAYPPGGAPPPLPAHPINLTGRIMAEGMNRLGWHWWPGTNAVASRDYGLQKQCVRYATCRAGCREGAKGSVDVNVFPVALKHGARVITGARVARVVLDEHGLARGAVYFRDGEEQFQPASVVVIACNGIGTPRLLLMSACSRFPDGLANGSGLVGKRLMLHPFGEVLGLYEEETDDGLGPSGAQIESMEFYATDTSRGFVRGTKWHVMATGGPLQMAHHLWRRHNPPDDSFWGENFTARMKQTLGHSIDWIIHAEDLPEEHNRVTLDSGLKDSDGLPAAAIHYRTSENTGRIFDFAFARAKEAHSAAGARESWASHRDLSSGHNLGTARMGDDPGTSVVDGFGRAHEVENLFVIDGSVFPTSTGTNPTATICAFARRAASHIVENARNQKTGSE